MNIFSKIILLFTGISIISIIYCYYLLWRNNRVYRYRCFIINTAYILYEKKIYSKEEVNNKIDNRISYDKMLYNPFYLLNPLKYFTKEELEKAYNGNYKRGICVKEYSPK